MTPEHSITKHFICHHSQIHLLLCQGGNVLLWFVGLSHYSKAVDEFSIRFFGWSMRITIAPLRHHGATGKAFGLAINRSRVQILLEVTLRNNLGQVVHTYVPLSPSSLPAKGRWCSEAEEVTAGLVKSNGSLPPAGWLTVTCGLTACMYTGISSGPNARHRVWEAFTFTMRNPACTG